jgi:hypothetical protein
MTYYIYIIALVNSAYFISYNKLLLTDFTDFKYEGINSLKLIDTIIIEDTINIIIEVDKIVKEYMIKYGINNVRGGSYINKTLDDWMIKSLEHEFSLLKKPELEQDMSIDKYIAGINIDNIDSEINIISSICENISNINNNIRLTDINIDIKELIENNKIIEELAEKLNKLEKEKQKYMSNGDIKREYYIIINKIDIEIQEIRQKLNNPSKSRNSEYYKIEQLKQEISRQYLSYCRLNNIEPKSYHNFEIQYYITKIYNNKQKELLTAFINKNGSLDNNILKLTALYNTKFNIEI